ncbi:serine threonine kinase [Fusarium albosuccineum]|uniref:Serine threonine kinase n=1 Tax=Fusarium albosuccineum TaxID=1237068 RepID=A0A8H4L1Z0_9HYPO|nr:serine threonine kinase [Fusarium albosuccineum]
MEKEKLLGWAVLAKLSENSASADSSLRPNRHIVIDTLREIQVLLLDFSQLDRTYKLKLIASSNTGPGNSDESVEPSGNEAALPAPCNISTGREFDTGTSSHRTLSSKETVRSIWFGIAYSWENLKRGTTTAHSSKTMIYAAPEVVRVEARNESADVWSLGCVFLEIATVLKGEEVQNMRERFRERSDRYEFHANREEIDLWMEQLRGVPTTTDDVVLDWAASMLRPVSSERPMAAQLFDEIADESTHRGVLFCGPCCLDDDGSTSNDEDDSHLWCDINTESR